LYTSADVAIAKENAKKYPDFQFGRHPRGFHLKWILTTTRPSWTHIAPTYQQYRSMEGWVIDDSTDFSHRFSEGGGDYL